MRDCKIFCALADLHIGNKNIQPDDMRRQLKKHFFKVVSSFPALDGIFICGDILHTIISLNTDYSELYLWFIDQVYKLARKKHATVIIVKGTPSHDNDQLSNIRSYQWNEDGVDFRIIEKPEVITIWDDYKVLVLPDVRPKELKEIDVLLDEYKQYDLILGHGTVDAMKFFIQESEHYSTKTYVYNVDKLKQCCKGPVLFGHIHQFQCIRDQFYYIGPFTLLERGGLNAGYVVGGIYDKDRTKWKVEQYENPDSAQYYDLIISKDIMDEHPIDEIIETIDDILKDAKENDLVTLRITRGDSMDAADKVLMLETRYRKDKRISIVKKIKTKSEEASERENQERKDKFSYIMDNTESMSSIMYKYYQTEIVPTLGDKDSAAANISIEDFKHILHEQAKRLMFLSRNGDLK